MNKINDKIIAELYANYAKLGLEEFREYCLNLIKTSRQPNAEIIHTLPKMRNKERILTTVNNFAMKGVGLGVVK